MAPREAHGATREGACGPPDTGGDALRKSEEGVEVILIGEEDFGGGEAGGGGGGKVFFVAFGEVGGTDVGPEGFAGFGGEQVVGAVHGAVPAGEAFVAGFAGVENGFEEVECVGDFAEVGEGAAFFGGFEVVQGEAEEGDFESAAVIAEEVGEVLFVEFARDPEGGGSRGGRGEGGGGEVDAGVGF